MVSVSSLPGINSENSRKRNVAIAAIYVFVILVVLGTAAPAEDTGTNNTDTNTLTDTMTTAATTHQTTSVVTDPPATEQQTESKSDSLSDSSGYSVKIIAEGSWSGSIMSGGSSKSVEETGTKTFKLDGNPSVVSANAQKQGTSSDKLTIQIIKNDKVVKESSTSAEYGLAQVSTSALDNGNNDKKSGYTVKISYDGKWQGSLGGDGSMRSVDGSGTETFTIKGDPFAVSANAQKQDSSSGTLTIQILKNGKVVKEATTDAEYGMAQVSVTA